MDLEKFNYECQGQINMFDITMPMISIENKIRLIELFAGYGSQAMGLEEMGVDFEHWKISEWEVNANKSYKACHIDDNSNYSEKLIRGEVIEKLFSLGISSDGKRPMTLKEISKKPEKWQRETYNEFMQCHNLGSITKVHGKDFEISDTDKYSYFFTYSYPCTSVSVAGKMEGMKEGSGTPSSLLWEVKRILTEIHESGGELPQILFMENVPQVLSSANVKDFHAWQDFLVSLGYTNHVQILNAKDYGVAQNRERAFMFSFLGEFNYKFPEPIPLTKTMKDYLEDEVPEKYYINTEKAQKLIEKLIESGDLQGCVGNINPSGNGLNGNVYARDIAPTLTTNKGEGQKICVDLSIKNPSENNIANCITSRENRGVSNQQSVGNGVLQIGNIMPTKTRENPNQGRVYDSDYISPSLNCMEGGGREPMIIELGRLNSSQDGIIVDSREISKTITAGNNNQPKTIVRMIGRNPDNPSDITVGAPTEQRLEPNAQGICNTITTFQKDNMVFKKILQLPRGNNKGGLHEISPTVTSNSFQENNFLLETIYRIRKLTPRECGRLMGVSDDNITRMIISSSDRAKDFFKMCEEKGIRYKGKREFKESERIQKMANSQLYKQFGNSVVVLCMVAMFSNLNIQGLPNWDGIKHKYFNPPYRA